MSGLSVHVHVPIYDFKTHQRSSDSFRQVNASDVIILEGILVFHDQRVRNLMNMKIFVDTDADVRLARRIRRDTVERGVHDYPFLYARLFSSLAKFSSIASEETMHLVLETLLAPVKAGHVISASIEPILSPIMLNMWASHVSDLSSVLML
ncbi:hypothetical protein ACS0TY_001792 [Phlomoides rotata]